MVLHRLHDKQNFKYPVRLAWMHTNHKRRCNKNVSLAKPISTVSKGLKVERFLE